VPQHILAPAVVACGTIIVRRSAHPAGGFFIIRKAFLNYKKNALYSHKGRLIRGTTFII